MNLSSAGGLPARNLYCICHAGIRCLLCAVFASLARWLRALRSRSPSCLPSATLPHSYQTQREQHLPQKQPERAQAILCAEFLPSDLYISSVLPFKTPLGF